jgi:hypothetical protein
LVLLPWRIVGGILGALTVNLFKKSCPECRHLMQYHRMVKPGEARLAD